MLGTGNIKHIQTIISLAKALHACLESGLSSGPPSATLQRPPGKARVAPAAELTRVLTVNDFLFATGLDNINLFQLLRCALNSGL